MRGDNNRDFQLRIEDGSGEEHTSYSSLYRRLPILVPLISLVQVSVFIYHLIILEETMHLTEPVPFKSLLIYSPYKRQEVWRYLSYPLVHAGYWHITFNFLLQMLVGGALERQNKLNTIAYIYLGSVLAGSLASSITDPHAYLLGASSGCFALITAYCVQLARNWRETNLASAKLFALIVAGSTDLLIAIYERHVYRRTIAYRTTYVGHLAGALSGLLLGIIFLRNVQAGSDSNVKLARWLMVVYLSFVILAIAFNLMDADHFPLPDNREPYGYFYLNPFRRDREI